MEDQFHWSDYVVFAFWLFLYSLVGVYHKFKVQIRTHLRRLFKQQLHHGHSVKKESDLFLSNRELSLLPVVSSLMASFLSAVSLLGTTSEVYTSGLQFSCMIVAYCIAFSITAEIYMPVFYQLKLACAHEYLELRFGKSVRFGASLLFCLQMWVYIALALYAPALVLSQITGMQTWISIISTGMVGTFYTALGGIRAVVWTDVIQLLLLTTGLLLIAIIGVNQVGGIGRMWTIAWEGKRVQSFSLDPNPFVRHTVWSLAIGGAGMVLSIFATNQTQIQRYLACRDLRTARRAILLNIPSNSIFLAIQLFCGLIIYTNFVGCDPIQTGSVSNRDQLLPYFVMRIFRNSPMIRGLFVSVIFAAALSTVSSGVNSLANVWLEDLIQPCYKALCGKTIAPRIKSSLGVILSALIGLATIGIAFLYQVLSPAVLQFSFILFGSIGGPILAVFTLGLLMPCVNAKGAMFAFIFSVVVGLTLGVGSILHPVQSTNLPLSTVNCSWNITAITTTQPTNKWSFYSLSYLYYSLACVLTAVVVGLLSSAIFGFNTHSPVSSRLLARQATALYSRLPDWIPTQSFVEQDFITDDGGYKGSEFPCMNSSTEISNVVPTLVVYRSNELHTLS